MAVDAVILSDKSFETVVKVTTTGTNSAASIVDASNLEGAASNPRLTLDIVPIGRDKPKVIAVVFN